MGASYRQDNEHFHYHNENPKNLVSSGDCVIRAIAYGTGLEWDTVYIELCNLGLKLKAMPNDKKVFKKYLTQLGFTMHSQPLKWNGTKYTVEEFAKENSDKKIIVNIANHLSVIDCGKIIDTWDCGYKCVGNYWIMN